jgi:predicted fused transcriptional regulator/phosphomethylpyrimidine kinase
VVVFVGRADVVDAVDVVEVGGRVCVTMGAAVAVGMVAVGTGAVATVAVATGIVGAGGGGTRSASG